MRWDLATRHKILLEVNNAVITNYSIDDFFGSLSTELRKHFHYDRLSIFIYDNEADSLTYLTLADGVQPKGFERNVRPLASGAVARMVIQSKQRITIKELSRYTDQQSILAMVNAGLVSTMAFPLIVRNRILGTLHMSFKKVPRDFSELADILTEVANQVAIAVGNMVTISELVEEKQNLEREKHFLINNADDYQPANFLYTSPAMSDLMQLARSVAEIDAPLLITGETGTGKDYVARYIHSISHRRDRLFVKVNCPALTSSLFESELFGHVKGAFTGADTPRVGRFEMADKGIIFLDEIAELPIDLQAKLLQVLQEHQIERVGDNRVIKTDFRLIAATNRDLSEAIEQRKFRQDLYYRLNILQIHIPPLRERREDIPYLIEKLNEAESLSLNRPAPKYTPRVIDFLSEYQWPGNVRELKNLVKRFVILKPGEVLPLHDIQNLVGTVGQRTPLYKGNNGSMVKSEQFAIEQALIESKGMVGGPNGAAKILGVPKSTLQYRIKKYGLRPGNYA
ncbi:MULTISPECIES: sigma-54 interaction domain-containing protein [Desulfosediminicola]|uniref:sigma-54 interaction domain-containing protein n=1 Tax=Desulfosediminicola TaxID=2886823 RepID=UPI0010ACE272|nr:sigma 54-interacting transcriptional regulator [Desulfosediminicola ganghwensis]